MKICSLSFDIKSCELASPVFLFDYNSFSFLENIIGNKNVVYDPSSLEDFQPGISVTMILTGPEMRRDGKIIELR